MADFFFLTQFGSDPSSTKAPWKARAPTVNTPFMNIPTVLCPCTNTSNPWTLRECFRVSMPIFLIQFIQCGIFVCFKATASQLFLSFDFLYSFL